MNTRRQAEDLVGAEIVAGRDLVAHLGIAWETLDQLADLARAQAWHRARDDLLTMSALLAGGALTRPLELLGDHIERRVSHVTEGVERTLEVLSMQSQRAWDSLFALWSPFFSVTRR